MESSDEKSIKLNITTSNIEYVDFLYELMDSENKIYLNKYLIKIMCLIFLCTKNFKNEIDTPKLSDFYTYEIKKCLLIMYE